MEIKNLQRVLFLTGLLLNFIIIFSFPKLSPEQSNDLIRYPRNGDDIRLMMGVIEIYSQTHFWHVALAYVSIYINFQSFGIPGTCFLAIMSGPIFGGVLGFILSHFCSIAGASLCYYMSK